MFSPRLNERGFILISAIWLLILCGSIAAILMLRSIGSARATAMESDELVDEALLEAAVETTFAGLLFSGSRSHAASVPATGTMTIAGREIQISITSETGRIDLNEFPLTKLDGTLQGLGVEARQRQRIIGTLQLRRAQKLPIRAQAEVAALLAGVEGIGPECLEDEFTIFSGFAEPRPSQMSARLARALALGQPGQAAASPAPEPIGAGTPLRLEVRLGAQAPLIVIARLTGLQPDPVSVYRWDRARSCAAS